MDDIDIKRYYEDCTICPRMCHVNRAVGETGYCRESSRIMAARAALHFWEEPCISGTTGSGAVFFSGCNMGCVFCQNYEIAHASVQREISVERLAEIFLELQEQKACNINLVTPTHYVPTIAAVIVRARDQGLRIPVVYNTSSYENVDTLRMLDGLVDIYLPDCKYYSSELSARYSGARDYYEIALTAISEMVRQTGRPVFYLDGIHPGIASSDECVAELSSAQYNDIIMSEDSNDGEDGHRSYDENCHDGAPGDYAGPLMKRGTIVRHLLLPSHLEDSKQVVRSLSERFGDQIFISLMNQYTPMPHSAQYQELTHRTSQKDYDMLVDYAIDLGIENAFIQGSNTDDESFIPAFDYKGL